ncbi:MAG: alpha-glucosidase family protein [Micavibrio sp.]|nr:alpha-glucosidase family protein [Micavibrio sp.]
MNKNIEWWRGAAFYQIYPRSFLDTNNDGTGDLPGITQKLEYIASLGIEGIWISPFYKSPMKDYGYDVSDYRDVDPMFGTIEDFDELLAKSHDLGMKVIIDLVLSHTSNQHPWFDEKPEYYVWADAKADGSPPNNWVSVFGGSAWEWCAHRGKYYLHNFLREQPDLNFHNPDVQEEALAACRFWLDRGVDGFRLDVINFLFHDEMLRNNPPRDPSLGVATQFEGDDPYSQQSHIYDKSRPEMLPFLERLRGVMDEYPDKMTLGEISCDNVFERTAEYTAAGRLNTAYNTDLMAGVHKDLSSSLIINPIEAALRQGGWPSWAFSNHDVVRAASRWLPDGDGFSHDPEFSKMLIGLLGCLYGTAFYYQGEELGLPEARLKFEELHDPWGIHLWPEWQGRDGCRTPIPWVDNMPDNGWLPVPDSHKALSVEKESLSENSTLNFTKKFLNWRKDQTCLKLGDIRFLETPNDKILHIVREYEGESRNCIFNFSAVPAIYQGRTFKPYGFYVSGFSDDD